MVTLEISLYYHLKQKAGVGTVTLTIPTGTTIHHIKELLEKEYPPLTTHLDNVMILKGKEIILEEEPIIEDTRVAFLTPIGGG